MAGDRRVRFCPYCRQNVYNLSGMTAAEATALLREKERTPCVRFYRRRDGTVLTADCPVGVRRIAGDASGWVVAAFLAALTVGMGLLGWGMSGRGPFLRATMGATSRLPARAGQGPEDEEPAGAQRPDENDGVGRDDEGPRRP
jgi:hypothetical protein